MFIPLQPDAISLEKSALYGKGKAVPLQAWSGPEGSRKLRFPDFMTTAHDGGRLSALGTGRLHPQEIFLVLISVSGPGSSVGIATDYELDSPGIESRWGRDFPPVQTSPVGHPCKMGSWSFPGVKCGRGMLLTTHPLLVPWSWKS